MFRAYLVIFVVLVDIGALHSYSTQLVYPKDETVEPLHGPHEPQVQLRKLTKVEEELLLMRHQSDVQTLELNNQFKKDLLAESSTRLEIVLQKLDEVSQKTGTCCQQNQEQLDRLEQKLETMLFFFESQNAEIHKKLDDMDQKLVTAEDYQDIKIQIDRIEKKLEQHDHSEPAILLDRIDKKLEQHDHSEPEIQLDRTEQNEQNDQSESEQISPSKLQELLLTAIEEGDSEKVQRLLKKGANPEYEDGAGDRPIHIAARCFKDEVLKSLLDHGADINARGHIKNTALHSASESGCLKCVQVLLKRRPKLELKNLFDDTPLLTAARFENCEIVNLLATQGADVEVARPGNDLMKCLRFLLSRSGAIGT